MIEFSIAYNVNQSLITLAFIMVTHLFNQSQRKLRTRALKCPLQCNKHYNKRHEIKSKNDK